MQITQICLLISLFYYCCAVDARENFDVIIIQCLLMQRCMKVTLMSEERVPSHWRLHWILPLDIAIGYCTLDIAHWILPLDIAIGYCTLDIAIGYCTLDIAIGYCTLDIAYWILPLDIAIGYCTLDIAIGYCTLSHEESVW